MTAAEAHGGSYRDPSGRVYVVGDRVLRTVMPVAVEDFEFVESSGALEPLVKQGCVVGSEVVPPDELGEAGRGAAYLLEHPRLPFVSYPYEWSFAALRAAALCHLDVHLDVLRRDVTLSDASAYNIQFSGPRPVFIDRLSFRRYREGELWGAHRQFCEQFLNPLLLRAKLGVAHNPWYRGQLEGISVEDTSRLLPLHSRLSWNVLTHVVLQARFQKSSSNRKTGGKASGPKEIKLPKPAFEGMLRGLRKWIARLEPGERHRSVWSDYAADNSYADDEARAKRAFVMDYASVATPRVLWDLGCNTGDYSKAALEAGTKHVVGFDFDLGALETAFSRALREDLDLLPLFLDAANPSPDQGWDEGERQGLMDRAPADGLLALAVLHHLAIARNVPLDRVVGWLVRLAPTGVIEFVPKNDPMVQELMRFKGDIFPSYGEQEFEAELARRSRIVRKQVVSDSGRVLYRYDRRD